MSNNQDPYIPGPSNGELQGVDLSMPDRGTSSGTVGMGSPYGADIGPDATNRMSGIGRSTRSDPMFTNVPQGSGDHVAGNEHESVRGRSMGDAAKSDPPDEDEANDTSRDADDRGY